VLSCPVVLEGSAETPEAVFLDGATVARVENASCVLFDRAATPPAVLVVLLKSALTPVAVLLLPLLLWSALSPVAVLSEPVVLD
jgi:hypothetical protein